MRTFLTLLCLSLAACVGPANTGTPSDAGGLGNQDGGNGTTDAGNGGPVSNQFGNVTAISIPGSSPFGELYPYFGTVTVQGVSWNQTEFGACTVWSPPQNPDAGVVVPANAGTITVTGGAMALSAPPPAAGQPYATANERTTPLFNGGEVLSFQATGGDVPAFTATLTAPGPVSVTSPAKPVTPPMVLDRASDLPVSWFGTTAGAVEVEVTGPAGSPYVVCNFDGSSGSGTVPASALQMVSAGNGAFAVLTINGTQTTLSSWVINVSAWTDAEWSSDGSLAQTSITLH